MSQNPTLLRRDALLAGAAVLVGIGVGAWILQARPFAPAHPSATSSGSSAPGPDGNSPTGGSRNGGNSSSGGSGAGGSHGADQSSKQGAAVPDVRGLTEQAARMRLKSHNLETQVTTSHSESVPAGQVISQDPPADQPAEPGSTVQISVSLGPQSTPPSTGGESAGSGGKSSTTGASNSTGSTTGHSSSTGSTTGGETSPGDTPWTAWREATLGDLDGKTGWQLTIMRNEIYARHGYIFQRADLSDYFEAKPWYHAQTPDMDAITHSLSSTERANANIILEYQTSHGLKG